ncbi:MAG: hypothetical protein EXX96DRAFT_582451 [Benjaminiella poitrasii]|nr:MAG: hypothetical protein EXX96DRAFT_582451 [Benjaminiella poitrasii]
MSQKIMYIRAKREKTSVFLCIQKSDSVQDIKTQLCKAIDEDKKPDEVRLLVSGHGNDHVVLENTKNLENDQVVYYVYFDRTEGEWEKINVIEPQLLDEDDELEEENEQAMTTKREKGKGRA